MWFFTLSAGRVDSLSNVASREALAISLLVSSSGNVLGGKSKFNMALATSTRDTICLFNFWRLISEKDLPSTWHSSTAAIEAAWSLLAGRALLEPEQPATQKGS